MDPAEPEAPRAANGRLLNVLGLAFGLAGSVGGTIGAGILRTPGLVAAQLPSGPWILMIWLLGGLYALLGACCIAELAAALPRAGGWYVYANAAFGRRTGLVVGWCDWLAHCIGLAWVATTGTTLGKAKVSVDGGTAQTIDLARASASYQQSVWATGVLPSGDHTVVITWDTSNATGKYVSVDAFDVIGTLK